MGVEFGGSYNRHKLNKEITKAMHSGFTVGMYDISGNATRRAPIDTSALRASNDLEIKKGKDNIKATLSFNTPYAWIQEHGEDFNHPKGGKAFFLRDAARTGVPKMAKGIAKRIKNMRAFNGQTGGEGLKKL